LSGNLLKRIAVAVVSIPLIIIISYLGGWWLFGLIILFAGVSAIEYLHGSRIEKKSIFYWLTLLGILCISIILMYINLYAAALVFIVFVILTGIAASTQKDNAGVISRNLVVVTFGVVWIGFFYPFVFLIRKIPPGGDWLLFLFVSLWLTDTFAMLLGKAFGEEKLAPNISPGKTVAGFFFGLLGGPLAALVLSFWRLSDFNLLTLLGAGILISIVGQCGDLVESIWKRSVGLKDSSNIIPGHGGVLDRFDSLLFAAPTLYLYIAYVIV